MDPPTRPDVMRPPKPKRRTAPPVSNHNQPTHFNFNSLTLRVIEGSGGEPWFLAYDVSKILGFVTPQMAYKRLDDSERSKVSRADVGMRAGKPAVLISESGLYKLVMRSDKAEAKRFQDWVTGTVLPAIRKDGGYVRGETPPQNIKNGQPYANSRDVAAFFGKRHDNVIKDIRGLLKSEYTLPSYFQNAIWRNPQNGQSYPAYDMTRDGFSLLVMGYTGPKAMEFKVRYIERFNAMEAELSKQPSQPQVPQSYAEALRAAAAQQR